MDQIISMPVYHSTPVKLVDELHKRVKEQRNFMPVYYATN